jgi:hypothetical protein
MRSWRHQFYLPTDKRIVGLIVFVGTALNVSGSIRATPVLAWGTVGHKVIAEIATQQLTPKARQAVERLLAHDNYGTTLVAVSTWADWYRQPPGNRGRGKVSASKRRTQVQPLSALFTA